jgi:hypothetical protein
MRRPIRATQALFSAPSFTLNLNLHLFEFDFLRHRDGQLQHTIVVSCLRSRGRFRFRLLESLSDGFHQARDDMLG